MNYWPGQQAIVVGGSIAGLITARVLSDFFERVLVIERDEIADRPVIHKSVPQGNHLMRYCMEVCRSFHRCIRRWDIAAWFAVMHNAAFPTAVW